MGIIMTIVFIAGLALTYACGYLKGYGDAMKDVKKDYDDYLYGKE